MSDLKDKAVSGFLWSAMERFGGQAVQFVLGLVLARLLLPEDYGLIGMLMIFLAIAQTMADSGFSVALIRKKEPTPEDFSTVFWFNAMAALVLYAVLFFVAPLISGFYGEPQLTPLVRVISLTVVFNSLGVVQKTFLIKKFNFKAQSAVTISSHLVAGLIALAAAYYNYGVWALVVLSLTRTFFINVAYWFVSNWKPAFLFSVSSFRELFQFGWKILVSMIISAVSDNLMAVAIGKLFSAKSLGFYTRASQFQKLPVAGIYGAINAISLPVLSQHQDDDELLRNSYRKIIGLIGFVIFPVMGLLASVAYPLIEIVLTERWLPSAGLLQVLCIVGAFYPLHAINLDILKVKGRSDLFLRLEIIKQLLYVLMIVICYRWEVYGLVWGLVALNVVSLFVNSFYTHRFIGISLFNQVTYLFRSLCFTAVMLLAVYFASDLLQNLWLKITLLPIIGVTVYVASAKIFKSVELATVSGIVQKLVKSK